MLGLQARDHRQDEVAERRVLRHEVTERGCVRVLQGLPLGWVQRLRRTLHQKKTIQSFALKNYIEKLRNDVFKSSREGNTS